MIADVNVASIDPTKLLHFLPECGQRSGDWACFSIPDYDAYTPHPRLRPCHNRAACDSRAAEQRDERAPLHSLTSSARASSVIGTAMPGSFLSRPLVPCDDRIPPRAHALQALKVAVHHLKRCAQHLLLCTRPQVGGRRVLTAESAKQSVMPPETCDARQLLRLPGGVVDVAPTPAILDKKIRRRVHIERCHEIIIVAAERRDDLLAVHERQVVALADVVERIQFDHQVMHSIYRCLNECKAMMARINVQKIGAHRSPCVVADAEAKQVTVERQCC